MLPCPECGEPFRPQRHGQAWCSSKCNRAAGNRELARGRVVYRALYWWRFDRSSAKMNLAFICREIRSWIDEDKAVGRAPPPAHRHDADRGHLRRARS